LHAQLEIWKAAYIDSSHIDSNMLASSTAVPSSSGASALSMNSQTSLWNQMLNDDSDSDGNFRISLIVEQPLTCCLFNLEEETENAMEIDTSSTKSSRDSAKEGEPSATGSVAKPKKKHHSHLQKKGAQSSHIHLWQFLKELLASPQSNGTAIRWLDRSKGIFKIEDSVRVARLWGRRKNRPAMNYDKLSRSIRQYYKKGIMKKTERSQRLVYQFCHPYSL
jgi:Ets-domain